MTGSPTTIWLGPAFCSNRLAMLMVSPCRVGHQPRCANVAGDDLACMDSRNAQRLSGSIGRMQRFHVAPNLDRRLDGMERMFYI